MNRNPWKEGDLFFHNASPNKIRRVHRVKGNVIWFLGNQYGANPPPGCLQAANYKLGDTHSWVRVNANHPVFTHDGQRTSARGQCEKCNTQTNWVVMVVDRPAYWCGCD